MKERIQEALRRRHRKGDEGFTLIELLVVILIIAILAAVGIVALLSALNSGKKSAAKTTLRNAITSVKSAQTGLGQTDFTGIGYDAATGTAANMNTEDPDLDWVGANQTGTGNTNKVTLVPGAGIVYLATRADNGVCYYAKLDSNGPSGYGSEVVGTGAACSTPAAGNTTATSTKTGWNK
ncbi:MAG: type II secretion system protein [Acidimicrobiia bacterium]